MIKTDGLEPIGLSLTSVPVLTQKQNKCRLKDGNNVIHIKSSSLLLVKWKQVVNHSSTFKDKKRDGQALWHKVNKIYHHNLKVSQGYLGCAFKSTHTWTCFGAFVRCNVNVTVTHITHYLHYQGNGPRSPEVCMQNNSSCICPALEIKPCRRCRRLGSSSLVHVAEIQKTAHVQTLRNLAKYR